MANAAENKTLRDYVGDTLDDLAGEHIPGVRGEVTEEGAVDVIWVESLKFHLDRDPEARKVLLDADDDEGVSLAEGVGQEWADLVKSHLPEGVDLEHADWEEWDDEPSIAISRRYTFDKGLDTPLEEVYEKTYPFVALMINGTDPGTFNHPYFVGDLVRVMMAKQGQ